MRKTERHRRILALLDREGFVSTDALAGELESAPITIRRDLAELDAAGHLSRVHGGAEQREGHHRFIGGSFERNLATNIEMKRRIAKAAATLCADGDSIVLDGGTTTYSMVPYLRGRHLSVLTNSLHIVEAFAADSDTRLLLAGGEVFSKQNVVLSPHDDFGVGAFKAAAFFMSAEAVVADGLKQSDSLLVQGERRMLDLAERTIVLADASKFERDAPIRVCGLDRVDALVCEGQPPKAVRDRLRHAELVLIHPH